MTATQQENETQEMHAFNLQVTGMHPRRQPFSVVFYTTLPYATSLPPYQYACLGTVIEHVKYLAFVYAVDVVEATEYVEQHFHTPHIESVVVGHADRELAPLMGTASVAKQYPGFFSWLRQAFS